MSVVYNSFALDQFRWFFTNSDKQTFLRLPFSEDKLHESLLKHTDGEPRFDLTGDLRTAVYLARYATHVGESCDDTCTKTDYSDCNSFCWDTGANEDQDAFYGYFRNRKDELRRSYHELYETPDRALRSLGLKCHTGETRSRGRACVFRISNIGEFQFSEHDDIEAFLVTDPLVVTSEHQYPSAGLDYEIHVYMNKDRVFGPHVAQVSEKMAEAVAAGTADFDYKTKTTYANLCTTIEEAFYVAGCCTTPGLFDIKDVNSVQNIPSLWGWSTG